jgi:hypothetical protein
MSTAPPVPSGNLPEDYVDHPATIGMAEMLKDGTLHFHLRTEAADGSIGEALMVVKKDDPKYAQMVAHVPGLKPGTAKPLPAFDEPAVDPDSV